MPKALISSLLIQVSAMGKSLGVLILLGSSSSFPSSPHCPKPKPATAGLTKQPSLLISSLPMPKALISSLLISSFHFPFIDSMCSGIDCLYW
ncbi:unnamed protein product [Linum trigynum]|uniref:Secreted protein n=1 Tax=Linum trigynum TaxID=586398 RepID=A0AAV2DTS6_9ROSI